MQAVWLIVAEVFKIDIVASESFIEQPVGHNQIILLQ